MRAEETREISQKANGADDRMGALKYVLAAPVHFPAFSFVPQADGAFAYKRKVSPDEFSLLEIYLEINVPTALAPRLGFDFPFF